MRPHLHPSPSLFALVVFQAIAMCFPAIWCQPYDVCGQSVQCGNIELQYPFWGLDRPAYCGHSGFQLTCQSNVPLLNYESVDYRVLDIDGSTQTIIVARNDLWSTSCPRYLHNTTYNSRLFNSNDFGQENVSMYYGCDTSGPLPVAASYQFSCDVNGSQSDGFFYRTNLIISSVANFFVRCNDYITIPVNLSLADQLASSNDTWSDLRSALMAGFNLQWTAYNDECDQCVRSDGQCGSNSTAPELFACYCANGNFSLTCNNTDRSGGSKGALLSRRKLLTGPNRVVQKLSWSLKLIIGLSCVFLGMLLFFLILCRIKMLRGARKAANHQIEMIIENYRTLAPKRFKYSEIKKMTNSFFEKLGQGAYGSVYKGQLPDGKLVAVKLLSEAAGDGEDFINEVSSISRTSHVNIVALLGFCIEGKKRALLYEFMPNGSLDKFLCADGSHLDWNTLFLIAKGIARGLEYLHRGCHTRIVHFDIKPHNILLDEEFIPKIADFGLAKLCKKKESIVSVTGARGTVGYMAPEVFFKSFGGASHKSDVYSYGMMVLEMTGARKNINANLTSLSEAYFPDWIYKQVEAGDNLGIHGLTTEVEEVLARKMVSVSLWCIQSDPSDRPSISKVVEMLEGSFESLQVPPRRFWSSPARPTRGNSTLATQTSTSEGLSIVQAVGEDFSS